MKQTSRAMLVVQLLSNILARVLVVYRESLPETKG